MTLKSENTLNIIIKILKKERNKLLTYFYLSKYNVLHNQLMNS